jgi:hypothetical protein
MQDFHARPAFAAAAGFVDVDEVDQGKGFFSHGAPSALCFALEPANMVMKSDLERTR